MPDIHIMRVESGEVHPAEISGGGCGAVSPTANVVKEGDAAIITITDQYGTTTATVYDGQPGGKGDPGDPGATPDISIGTVSTLEPGEDATVTIGGTAAAPVLSFGIPKGAKGDPSAVAYRAAETPTGDNWIDGKPIYRRILSMSVADVKTWYYTGDGIADADTIVRCDIVLAQSGNQRVYNGSHFYNTGRYCSAYLTVNDGLLRGTAYAYTDHYLGQVRYIVEYTKTTD